MTTNVSQITNPQRPFLERNPYLNLPLRLMQMGYTVGTLRKIRERFPPSDVSLQMIRPYFTVGISPEYRHHLGYGGLWRQTTAGWFAYIHHHQPS